VAARPYMRNPPAAEIMNEEVSNLLERKVKASISRLDELEIAFDYQRGRKGLPQTRLKNHRK
jgi:hypothetical protein